MSILTIASTTAASEEEIVRKLVGRWEGTVAIKNNPFRTLVINSVKREGDHWIAAGRWVSKEEKAGRKVDIKVQVNGDDVSLAFDAQDGNDVKLKLAGDRELTGLFEHARARKRVNSHVSLKKVD
jgi:hypothetical protein